MKLIGFNPHVSINLAHIIRANEKQFTFINQFIELKTIKKRIRALI